MDAITELSAPVVARSARELLIRWANAQDGWVRLATAKVLDAGAELSDADADALYAQYLAEKGLSEVETAKVESLSASDSVAEDGAVLKLVRLDSIEGVNALASDQEIEFNPQLTVVFGENGAGKTGYTRSAHPRLAIGWRSVHGRGSLMPEMLRRCGYRLIPARSVLFTDTRGSGWARVRDTTRDRSVYEKSAYRARLAVVDPLTGMSPLPVRERIAQLYAQLYVDKCSRLNPRYTAAFIGAAQQSGLLEFVLLEHEADVRIDGVFGFRAADGFLAAPVLGYDTALPQELGLYRMLSYLVTRTAHENGVQLHNSSGVAEFKRNRGAEPEFEYTAVYTRHLPWRHRVGWRLLETVVRTVAVPLVLREGL